MYARGVSLVPARCPGWGEEGIGVEGNEKQSLPLDDTCVLSCLGVEHFTFCLRYTCVFLFWHLGLSQ